MRARLGPTAWLVLEELLLRGDGRGWVGEGVRGLAAGLGLDKDTVARGLRRLRAAGLVSRCCPGRLCGRDVGVPWDQCDLRW